MEQENIPGDEEKETFILSSNIHSEEGIPVSDEEEENALEFNHLEHNNLASAEARNVPSTTVHVVDGLSVASEISNYIQVNRINLGELDTSIDMWAICDAISAAHSGLPDSLLREAFLLVLDGSYAFAQNNSWIRGHLDTLSRVWKREMTNEKCTNRPTKFVSSSADISSPKSASGECVADSARQPTCLGEDGRDQQQPQHAHDVDGSGVAEKALETSKSRRQRRHVAKRKRALAVMMGVGQMLQARRTLTTEGGQMDVDEDEYGNFSIGGTELTFESWGKLNTIQEADIVHSGDQQQPIQDQDSSVNKPQQQQQNGCRVEEKPEDKMEKLRQSNTDTNIGSPMTAGEHQKRGGDNDAAATALLRGMAQRYPTVAEVEVPSLMPATVDDRRLPPTTNAAVAKVPPKKAQKVAKMERKQKRRAEKDEGELSSSDSEEPTSSDEEDNDNDDFGSSADEAAAAALQSRTLLVAARERRRMRRVDEQKQGASSAQNLQALLRKCFELRTRIVGKLSIGQKAMFRDCLSKSISGTLQQQSQQPQQHQLQQLIHSVAGKPAADVSAEMVFP
uniref:PHD-type domain-containing protein n=1 Tax=Globodera pallida TaxID=36090 RepID=A0A183BKN9_GLOPA